MHTKSAWTILVNQFRSLIVALLGAAAIVALAFGDWVEAAAIIGVLLINGLLGFFAELRAVRSMEALRQLGNVQTRVRRDGRDQLIDAEDLVVGDIVIVDGGDVITADLRLLDGSKLRADESLLTGESVPVGKTDDPVDRDTDLADRRNMLFKGTSVTRGTGEAVVIAVGMQTELGRIASMVTQEEESTALEDRLAKLGRRLIVFTLAIAAATSISGIVTGKDLKLMIETGIALAVAAIPEGLPIVATIALARGMWRMAKRNALINRLPAVETLGSTMMIFTDKTGTLTENRMTVQRIVLADGEVAIDGEGMQLAGDFKRNGAPLDLAEEPVLTAACEVCAMCNNASLSLHDGQITSTGDPLEIALLVLAAKAGITRSELLARLPEQREEAFDPTKKMMATFHEEGSQYHVAVKGATETVLDACINVLGADGDTLLDDAEKQHWHETNDTMAQEGLRVLALAQKRTPSLDDKPYEGLTLIGLLGMLDPPRSDVCPAIQACHDAGIRVVMVTGDHSATAVNIAEAVGVVDDEGAAVISGRELRKIDASVKEETERICGTPIFARVDPEQKLELIELQQRHGQIVAMTGDGVNDAPALRRADIGIAMGKRGTQVAREAADMVLTDDAFASIVEAVRQGRIIFNNIRKFVLYLMSCNLSEVLVVAAATVLGLPLPLLPLQILFLNLVTDVFPALALAMGEGDEHVMRQPPRPPQEPVLRRHEWMLIAGGGAVITLCVLAAMFLAMHWLGRPQQHATTISFLTLAFAQVWHVFNMRSRSASWWRNDVTQNRWVWAAVALCSLLALCAVYAPGLSDLLATTKLNAEDWLLVATFSLLPLLFGQLLSPWLAPRSRVTNSNGVD